MRSCPCAAGFSRCFQRRARRQVLNEGTQPVVRVSLGLGRHVGVYAASSDRDWTGSISLSSPGTPQPASARSRSLGCVRANHAVPMGFAGGLGPALWNIDARLEWSALDLVGFREIPALAAGAFLVELHPGSGPDSLGHACHALGSLHE